MRTRTAVAFGIVWAIALSIAAQEPRPARLQPSSFGADGIVDLNFAWRYAPGDGAERAAISFDDSRWAHVAPALRRGEMPPSAWHGVGWFRRHLLVSPALQGRPVAVRISGPGAAEVYLDGRTIVAAGSQSTAAIPGIHAEDAIVRFTGSGHVLAVRYVYPPSAPRPVSGFGFTLLLGNLTGHPVTQAAWIVAFRGATVALPFFLACLHLILFAFDRRARENLFYALEMLTFSAILLHEYADTLISSDALRALVDQYVRGMASIAILFGALTYYALRTHPWPKSWRLFAVAGVGLYFASFLTADVELLWVIYFLALVVEILRIERSRKVRRRAKTRFFLASFAVFAAVIILQILVDYGVVESIAGIREVYIFGILVSAVGMSLQLASTLGQSRITEMENIRKSEELQKAREIQLSMLPASMPQMAGLDIAAATQTAAEVGGDYYDVRLTGDGSLLFAFGDATGHGLAAGIVVTAAKALFTSLDAAEAPDVLLAHCNRAMAAMDLPTLRMCLSLARVTRERVTIAQAAMPPLLIRRAATDAVEELGAGGLPLGGRIGDRYRETAATLAHGDVLLFASDGFAEQANAAGAQLGYDGAAALFRRCAGAATAREIVERLFDEASRFRGTIAQGDDITFVAIRVA